MFDESLSVEHSVAEKVIQLPPIELSNKPPLSIITFCFVTGSHSLLTSLREGSVHTILRSVLFPWSF